MEHEDSKDAPTSGADDSGNRSTGTERNGVSAFLFSGVAGLLWSSKVGLIGMATTTVTGCLLVTVIVAELSGFNLGQYAGLVAYTLLPAVFALGLLLMPVGIWLARRERARIEASGGEVFELGIRDLLRAGAFFVAASAVNLVIMASVSYQAYHYTETVEFCGSLCHTVMSPEHRTHDGSPHARVACVDCHIGSGASWFVKSKLSGVRQVVAVIAGNYNRPIPSPVHDLRPARDTCEQCHWPDQFHGKYIKAVRRFTNSNTTEPMVSAVMLKVGGLEPKTGKHSGIHWHVSEENKVYYRATDETRLEIAEVRVVRADGSETLYRRSDNAEKGSQEPWRLMDCVDCHNRPTHVFDIKNDAVDEALYKGTLDPKLPDVRKLALDLLSGEYASNEEGTRKVREAFMQHYESMISQVNESGDDGIRERVSKSADTVSEIYGRNIFPEMKITWKTYPNHIGHKNFLGCFRCHDEEHETEDGYNTISQDCDLCHTILADEEASPDILKELEEL